jgi:hypothetical protein
VSPSIRRNIIQQPLCSGSSSAIPYSDEVPWCWSRPVVPGGSDQAGNAFVARRGPLAFRCFVSPLGFGSALTGKPHYREGQGNLFPFALNASPNGVSLPPPVALSWHCPQAFPVSLANLAVASAGREMTRLAVPAIKISVAVLKTATSAFLAFIFIVVSGLWTRLVQSPQAEPLRANVRPCHIKHEPKAEARSVRSGTSLAIS